RCVIVLSLSGHMGLFITHGSIKIVFPSGVSNRNVAWPSQVSFTPFRFMGDLSLVVVLGGWQAHGPRKPTFRIRCQPERDRCHEIESNRSPAIVLATRIRFFALANSQRLTTNS